MIGIKLPFAIIGRKEYAELKSLRNFFKQVMQMRADQRDFEICPDNICGTNKAYSEKHVDKIITDLLIHKK